MDLREGKPTKDYAENFINDRSSGTRGDLGGSSGNQTYAGSAMGNAKPSSGVLVDRNKDIKDKRREGSLSGFQKRLKREPRQRQQSLKLT